MTLISMECKIQLKFGRFSGVKTNSDSTTTLRYQITRDRYTQRKRTRNVCITEQTRLEIFAQGSNSNGLCRGRQRRRQRQQQLALLTGMPPCGGLKGKTRSIVRSFVQLVRPNSTAISGEDHGQLAPKLLDSPMFIVLSENAVFVFK
jgi:hypothetical protein